MTRRAQAEKLSFLLEQARRLAPRLESARAALITHGPLDERLVSAATETEATLLDVFLFRYMRMQDIIGGRVFPALLEAGAELPVESAYIDKLHVLERLNIIDTAEAWMELRVLRNQMTHDYPEPAVRLSILRNALETVPTMFSALDAVGRYAVSKLGALNDE